MQNRKIKHFLPNVRSRLLCIFLSAVSIPVILYGIFVSFSSSKELEQENYKTYQQMTNQIGAVFSEYISRTDQTLRSVDNSPSVAQFLRNETIVTVGLESNINILKDNAYTSLKQLGDTNNSIFSLTAITLNGDSVSCVEKNQDLFLNNIHGEYYAPLRRSTGNTVVLPIQKSSFECAASREVFTVGYRYLDSSGYTGYILAECPTEKFEEFCTFVQLDSDINVYILDQNGQLAYTTEHSESQQRHILSKLKGSPEGGRVENEKSDYMLVNSPLANTGWTAYTVIPYHIVTDNSRQLLLTFFWLCMLCMAIIILVTYAVSGYFTKPVITLQKAMRKVSDGDLTVRISENRSDEFGDLNQGFNDLMDKLDGLIKDISEAQSRKNAAEYQMLQSQINPHFLYNTLDTIRMMAVLSDEDTIATALLHLSTLFRYHTRKNNRLVTVKEEIEQIQNYLYLQKLRFEGQLEITYQIQSEVLSCQMPKILLQPILENCLSHGFLDIEHPYLIQIEVFRKEDSVRFVIRDNGRGMSSQTLEQLSKRLDTLEENEHYGIGLYNVNRRLHLYYPDTKGLQIESTYGKGTCVSFSIPTAHRESTLFKYDDYLNTNGKKEELDHE